jgi:hypothetical protein
VIDADLGDHIGLASGSNDTAAQVDEGVNFSGLLVLSLFFAVRAVFANQILAVVFHHCGIVGDVVFVPAIAIQREFESVDAVFLFKADA